MKRYLVFTCFLSIRQIVLKFVPEYDNNMVSSKRRMDEGGIRRYGQGGENRMGRGACQIRILH